MGPAQNPWVLMVSASLVACFYPCLRRYAFPIVSGAPDVQKCGLSLKQTRKRLCTCSMQVHKDCGGTLA